MNRLVPKSAATVSLVDEARGGPFIFWDDLHGAFEKASSMGFDAVEIFPPSPGVLDVIQLRQWMDRYSLSIAAIGTGAGWVKHKLRLTDPNADVRQRAVEFVEQTMDVAASLGAMTIIGSMQGRWGDGVSREGALGWLGEALSHLEEKARMNGQTLLYEPLNRYETNLIGQVDDAIQFLTEARVGNSMKLLCDLFHMNLEEVDIGMALRRASEAGRLGHIHWADSNRRAGGWGHTDFSPIAQVLGEVNYAGYISAEALPWPDSDSAARQTLVSFRQWFR